jgi:hypothetical protein
MIQLPERHFGYFLVQCADEERDESLNVGVVVFDAEGQHVRCRIADSLDRIERTLPNVPVPHVRAILSGAEEHATEALSRFGVEGLAELTEKQRFGTVRFSPLRSILARHIDQVSRELLQRYVEVPPRYSGARDASGGSDQAGQYTSRRVISAVETRLQRLRLVPGSDYKRDVTLFTNSESALKIPVWFPIVVGDRLFLDGLDIKPDLNRTLDGSRAIAQKLLEAHRAKENAQLTVFIRDPEMGKTGDLAEAVIHDALAGEEYATVRRYSRPDDLDASVPETLQTTL